MPAGEVAPPAPQTVLNVNEFEPPQWEFSAESAYLLGIIGNPNSYELGAEFVTARLRWGVNRSDDSIFRGYNQVYLLGMVEPIFRGPENHYFGISMGFRHVFVQPGWRLQPYTSGGAGLGWIDSTDAFRHGALGASIETAAELIRAAQAELVPLPGNRYVDSLFGLGEALHELLEQLRS